MRREDKEAKVEMYDQAVASAGFALLLEHAKISVPEMEAMRNELQAIGSDAIVLKNTLARIVFERHGIEAVCEYLAGPSLLVYGEEEISPVAKVVQKMLRKHIGMRVKAIVFDRGVYPAEEFRTFTSMPTKQEVRGRLAGVIQAPVTMLVRVLHAPQRLARVLGAYVEKRGGSE